MICFNKDLLEKGAQLIEECDDLVDLKQDAQEILSWINRDINISNYKQAQQFDNKIRTKHEEILPLNILANTIASIKARVQGNQGSPADIIEHIYDTLKFDYNVILGKALLKTNKFLDLSEILDQ